MPPADAKVTEAQPGGGGEPARFVAVGHNGLRIRSLDGQTWSGEQIGKEGETFRAVSHGNGRFVAVANYGGANLLASSADGATWQILNKDAKYANYVRGLTFGRGMFLALGGDPGSVGGSKPFAITSPDGVAWSDFTMIAGKNILRRAAFGNDLFVGVGDRGRRAASKDGLEWVDAPDVKAIDTLVDVAFGKDLFVGVGLHGLRMASEDGLKWTPRQVGDEGEHLNSVLWAGDRFVAVGMGATYVSPDGMKWERHANKNAPLTATFGHGVFVGANWRGRLLRSTDAIEWQDAHKCEHHVEAIASA